MTELTEVQAIRARVRTLERRHRWFLGCGALVLLVFGTGLLMGSQAARRGQFLEGERFSLRDATGKEQAWLGLDQGKAVLRLLNANGQVRAGLEIADEGIILRVQDAHGRLQTGLSLEDRGVAIVNFNKDGRTSAGENAVMNQTGIFAGHSTRAASNGR